jgi:hypothetical protein
MPVLSPKSCLCVVVVLIGGLRSIDADADGALRPSEDLWRRMAEDRVREYLLQNDVSFEYMLGLVPNDHQYGYYAQPFSIEANVHVGLQVILVTSTGTWYEIAIFVGAEARPLVVGGFRHIWTVPMDRLTQRHLETSSGSADGTNVRR